MYEQIAFVSRARFIFAAVYSVVLVGRISLLFTYYVYTSAVVLLHISIVLVLLTFTSF